VVAEYRLEGKEENPIQNLAIEYEDCNEVLLDFDKIEEEIEMIIPKEYQGKETKYKCKNCNSTIFEEIEPNLKKEYGFVCLCCDENMFEFEVIKTCEICGEKSNENFCSICLSKVKTGKFKKE